MSNGTQVDLQWAVTDTAQGGEGAPPLSAPLTDSTGARYMSDEEILGIEPTSSVSGFGGHGRQADGAGADARTEGGAAAERAVDAVEGKAGQTEVRPTTGAQMPEWMAAAAADPAHGAAAQRLWREHQEFSAAFGSVEEARAVKELLPGGVKDVLSLREATQSVERIDAALFSGDARAQSEVVAELARANPAAFRSMFAEAARVLAGMGVSIGNGVGPTNGSSGRAGVAGMSDANAGPTLRKDGEGWGTQAQNQNQKQNQYRRQDAGATGADTNHESQITNNGFDPAAYAAFERSTNDTVARDVRGSISDTLARVMPEGVADGAARRMGEDIFNEVHRALAADRALSEQVAGVLSDRRFGVLEQQRVAALIAGRAKQLVPSVARRVIGEWTGTVLNTARSKAARQNAAASRVDIAAAGGSLDSMPLRAMSAREVNYASMSDEEILGI